MMKKILFLSCVFLFGIILKPASGQTFKDYFKKGYDYYNAGQYDQAIEIFEKSIELNPDFGLAFYYLGLSYKAVDVDLKQVVWYFKEAIKIDPNNLEAYDALARTYHSLGEIDKSIHYCKKALEINPDMGSIRMSLAWAYLLGKSKPLEAAYHFKKVLEKYPIPVAYYGLGLAYLQSGQEGEVLGVITHLRSIRENDLAVQLEDMLRGGPVYNTYKPGSSRASGSGGPSSVIVPGGTSSAGRQTQSLPVPKPADEKIMRVRLRGNFVPVEDEP